VRQRLTPRQPLTLALRSRVEALKSQLHTKDARIAELEATLHGSRSTTASNHSSTTSGPCSPTGEDDASSEADEECAMLVKKGTAWACMSEDMDMFVYGVPRVIRYFSLLNHTIVLYNTIGILQELRMTQKEFSEVCILSGTDYNLSNHSRQVVAEYGSLLNDSVILFKQYKNYSYTDGFYNWLLKENLIRDDEYKSLNHIYQMFVNETSECVDIVNNIKPQPDNLLVCKDKLRCILENDGFIYK
jgi:hypothetical protein